MPQDRIKEVEYMFKPKGWLAAQKNRDQFNDSDWKNDGDWRGGNSWHGNGWGE